MVRLLSALTVLLVALVVMSLPGTTNATSAPAAPRPEVLAVLPPPILLAVSLERLLRGAELATARPLALSEAPLPPSYYRDAQIVSIYGYPGVCFMGELGCHDPEGAADEVQRLAHEYDALNGERGAVAALHLIVSVAQASKGDGTYLGRMPIEGIERYVELARARDMLLFVDVQVGWSDALIEVERLRTVLQEPFVHVGLDPEFATRAKNAAPGQAIGSLDAWDVNRVQAYLAAIARLHHLPPKILVLHQFQPGMLTNKPAYETRDEVEITIDMDGFGGPAAKLSGYEAYARVDAEYSAFKLFFHWDTPLIPMSDLVALPHPPDYVIYQ